MTLIEHPWPRHSLLLLLGELTRASLEVQRRLQDPSCGIDRLAMHLVAASQHYEELCVRLETRPPIELGHMLAQIVACGSAEGATRVLSGE